MRTGADAAERIIAQAGRLRRRLEAKGSGYPGVEDELWRDAAPAAHDGLDIAGAGRLLDFRDPDGFERRPGSAAA